ncbi:hypothetical protein BV511_03140 [Methylorubrum extorquens]|uniref:hypothetical protein n=1 Tax=Methylorubrum extorquens TaxID=408 RepID=UPI0009726E59|nr:hypothetical protein [Methylorubrum extorquens]APX83810.1 hypothetical protein BV511_03140 [Methylorubrum extorquens]
MSDLIKMRAKTTFQNDRIRGGVNGAVSDGDLFETDRNHAIDLARLGHADPVKGSVLDIGVAPLDPHHSVSGAALQADRERRDADLRSIAQTVLVARENAEREIADVERKASERLEAIGRDLVTAEGQRDERLRALADEVREAEEVARAAVEAANARAAAASAEGAEPRADAGEGEGASSESKKRRGAG